MQPTWIGETTKTSVSSRNPIFPSVPFPLQESWIVSIVVNFFLLEFALPEVKEQKLKSTATEFLLKLLFKNRICEESSKSLEGQCSSMDLVKE